jgi:organic radical activating enzyme
LGGTVWSNRAQNILAQWTSDELESLRTEFVNNRQSPICNRCWHEEANNKKSLRLRLFDPVAHTSDYTFITDADSVLEKIRNRSYLNGPEVLTIKNGNVCNAKCRVCHPGDSSRWASDAVQLQTMLGKTYYAVDQRERNWTNEQLDEIVELSANLKRLELFGGEPIYNKKVHEVLKRIVDSGDSQHITLYINTNGSIDLVDRIPYVKEFQAVEIGVSIDGVGRHFDYIRHGLEYDTVKKNVVKWQEYFEKHQVRYFIDSISTVEILNVYYLPELKSAVQEFLPLTPFWNLLVDPAYLFIKNMPDPVKEAVIKKLSLDSEFDDLITVMQQPADLSQWKKFLEVTQALDVIRGESFTKTFPEFVSLFE